MQLDFVAKEMKISLKSKFYIWENKNHNGEQPPNSEYALNTQRKKNHDEVLEILESKPFTTLALSYHCTLTPFNINTENMDLHKDEDKE